MKTAIYKTSKIFIIFTIISLMMMSCAKEKDTIGIVKVVNVNGNPISGATVVLNQQNGAPGTDPIDNLRQEKTTDNTGKAEFTYTYEAILDVTVSKVDGNDTYTGSNVIRLLRGKTVTQVVEAVIQ